MPNNSLPRGFVLAPLLFNLNIKDLPVKIGTLRKLLFAGDIVLVCRSKDFEGLENTLEVFDIIHTFYYQWRLKHNQKRKSPSSIRITEKQTRRYGCNFKSS